MPSDQALVSATSGSGPSDQNRHAVGLRGLRQSCAHAAGRWISACARSAAASKQNIGPPCCRDAGPSIVSQETPGGPSMSGGYRSGQRPGSGTSQTRCKADLSGIETSSQWGDRQCWNTSDATAAAPYAPSCPAPQPACMRPDREVTTAPRGHKRRPHSAAVAAAAAAAAAAARPLRGRLRARARGRASVCIGAGLHAGERREVHVGRQLGAVAVQLGRLGLGVGGGRSVRGVVGRPRRGGGGAGRRRGGRGQPAVAGREGAQRAQVKQRVERQQARRRVALALRPKSLRSGAAPDMYSSGLGPTTRCAKSTTLSSLGTADTNVP